MIKARMKEVERGGEKACQLVVSGYQRFKNRDSGGEEAFLFEMATARTIMYCVFHRLLGASRRREAKRLSARLRQRAPLWAWRWGEDPSLLGKLFLSRGSRLSPWLLFFWARRKREGGHAPLVMYRGLAWAQNDATHPHPHTI